MPESEHLGTKFGMGAGTDQDEIDREEYELVNEAEKHARGTRPAAAKIRDRGLLAQLRGIRQPSLRGAPSELTLDGIPAHVPTNRQAGRPVFSQPFDRTCRRS